MRQRRLSGRPSPKVRSSSRANPQQSNWRMRSAFWVKEQWRRLPTEWLGCVLVVYRYRLKQDHRDRSSLNSPEPQERCVGKHDHTFESVIMAHVANSRLSL